MTNENDRKLLLGLSNDNKFALFNSIDVKQIVPGSVKMEAKDGQDVLTMEVMVDGIKNQDIQNAVRASGVDQKTVKVQLDLEKNTVSIIFEGANNFKNIEGVLDSMKVLTSETKSNTLKQMRDVAGADGKILTNGNLRWTVTANRDGAVIGMQADYNITVSNLKGDAKGLASLWNYDGKQSIDITTRIQIDPTDSKNQKVDTLMSLTFQGSLAGMKTGGLTKLVGGGAAARIQAAVKNDNGRVRQLRADVNVTTQAAEKVYVTAQVADGSFLTGKTALGADAKAIFEIGRASCRERVS
jgi:hypothetical protein